MFIVPQDWFIDSRESVVTISVIICATGYIITVWARYIRHLIFHQLTFEPSVKLNPPGKQSLGKIRKSCGRNQVRPYD